MLSCRSATSRSPLRSNRARTSPVSPRSNASGLTRTKVRELSPTRAEGYRRRAEGRLGRRRGLRPLIARRLAAGRGAGGRAVRAGLALHRRGGLARARGLAGRGGTSLLCAPLRGRLGTPLGSGGALRSPHTLRRALALGGAARFLRGAARRRGSPTLRRLTVRADGPSRIDRPLAGLTGILDPGAAMWTAQVRALDRVPAIGTGLLLELPDAELGGTGLELALAGVLQELRRPQDRVDDRADVRKERGHGGAGNEHRVLDPPRRVQVGPGDQRDPDDHEKEDEEVHEEVQALVRDAEHRYEHGRNRMGEGRSVLRCVRRNPWLDAISRETGGRRGTRGQRRPGSRSPPPQRPSPSSGGALSAPLGPCVLKKVVRTADECHRAALP